MEMMRQRSGFQCDVRLYQLVSVTVPTLRKAPSPEFAAGTIYRLPQQMGLYHTVG